MTTFNCTQIISEIAGIQHTPKFHVPNKEEAADPNPRAFRAQQDLLGVCLARYTLGTCTFTGPPWTRVCLDPPTTGPLYRVASPNLGSMAQHSLKSGLNIYKPQLPSLWSELRVRVTKATLRAVPQHFRLDSPGLLSRTQILLTGFLGQKSLHRVRC